MIVINFGESNYSCKSVICSPRNVLSAKVFGQFSYAHAPEWRTRR